MTIDTSFPQNADNTAMRSNGTIEAKELLTPHGKIRQQELDQSDNLEEYAHGLEKKLILKSGLLDEAIRLHQGLNTRLNVLENGLSWKDAQLEELSRQNEEICRISVSWRQRAERLEEDNCAQRDALIEEVDQKEQLQRLLSLEMQSRAKQPVVVVPSFVDDTSEVSTTRQVELLKQIEFLKKQVKEANQKTVLLEEQLRIRSGVESLGGEAAADLGGAFPELALLQPKDAWASVGHGAADRICGSVPHVAESLMPHPHKMSLGSADRSRFSSHLSEVREELRQLDERNRVMTFDPTATDYGTASDTMTPQFMNSSTPPLVVAPMLNSGFQAVPLVRPPYQVQDESYQEVARNVSGVSTTHIVTKGEVVRPAHIVTTGEPSVAGGFNEGIGRHRLSNTVLVDSTPISPVPGQSRRERSPDVGSPTASSHAPQQQQNLLRIPVRGRASQIRPEVLPPTASRDPNFVPPWVQQSPQATTRTPSVVVPARSISSHLFRGTPNTPTSATSSTVASLWASQRTTASNRE